MTFGELLHRDGDYFGDPVNLAARLANAAPTGTVLVDGAVAKRIGDDAFRRHAPLEGFADPVEVFLVRRAATRSAALAPDRANPQRRRRRLRRRRIRGR